MSNLKQKTPLLISFLAKTILRRANYHVLHDLDFPHRVDMPKDFIQMAEFVRPYTQTSLERMYSLHTSICHLVKHKIPGDIVECGVWRGGSAMIAAMTLKALGDTSRKIYLYDTYTGMTKPLDIDVDHTGASAMDAWKQGQGNSEVNEWNYVPLEEVEANMNQTGYPKDKLVYVKGMVEDTIPKIMPAQIALLRLDTDFYESTKHELEHMFPLLSKGGFLILDDYGHFQGAQKAVDEYFAKTAPTTYLNRIDYCGRVIVK